MSTTTRSAWTNSLRHAPGQYRFEDEQLTGAIASLLADEGLKPRHLAVSQQLQASPGNVRAADLIERLAATGEPLVTG